MVTEISSSETALLLTAFENTWFFHFHNTGSPNLCETGFNK